MKEKPNNIQNAGKVLLEEINAEITGKDQHKRSIWSVILIPVLAILTGLIIGAILIVATSSSVYAAFGESFWSGIKTSFREDIYSLRSPVFRLHR